MEAKNELLPCRGGAVPGLRVNCPFLLLYTLSRKPRVRSGLRCLKSKHISFAVLATQQSIQYKTNFVDCPQPTQLKIEFTH
ncbi:hypothetical protein SADUNF_Sadunf10G0128700 [Salix dunnii]|uniref:Uncharacterized protein n=1 Tax=Salix dunnii TaxID=1413687 RepID=A0A835MPT2_9ROSI|nr:hypothetical protein SADUNF_Sadunf10G0128700 [Salix dunnii]